MPTYSQLLVKVVEFTITPFGSVTIPHGLRSEGKPVRPTLIQPDRATSVYVVSANVVNAVFQNPDDNTQTLSFRFEYGLSNELDSATVGDLYWKGGPSAGGGSAVTFPDLGLVTFPTLPPAPVSLGSPVAIVGGQIVTADAASIATAPAVGFYDGASNLIRTSGILLGLSGLPANTTVYLAAGGGISATPPVGAGKVAQALGSTIGTTGIFISIGSHIVL